MKPEKGYSNKMLNPRMNRRMKRCSQIRIYESQKHALLLSHLLRFFFYALFYAKNPLFIRLKSRH